MPSQSTECIIACEVIGGRYCEWQDALALKPSPYTMTIYVGLWKGYGNVGGTTLQCGPPDQLLAIDNPGLARGVS
jgi:hypothetical protein